MKYSGKQGGFSILLHRGVALGALALVLAAGVFVAHRDSKRFALHQVERVLDGRIEAHKRSFLDNLGKIP